MKSFSEFLSVCEKGEEMQYLTIGLPGPEQLRHQKR